MVARLTEEQYVSFFGYSLFPVNVRIIATIAAMLVVSLFFEPWWAALFQGAFFGLIILFFWWIDSRLVVQVSKYGLTVRQVTTTQIPKRAISSVELYYPRYPIFIRVPLKLLNAQRAVFGKDLQPLAGSGRPIGVKLRFRRVVWEHIPWVIPRLPRKTWRLLVQDPEGLRAAIAERLNL